MIDEIRRSVYGAVGIKSLNFSLLLQRIQNSANFDVAELMSQHSTYVDLLVQDFQNFNLRLNEVSVRVPVPKEAYDTLWQFAILMTNRVLVEG